MKRETHIGRIAALLVAIAVLLTGFGETLPPVKPIKDFKDIAGKWEGPFITNRGREIETTRTIKENGTSTTKSRGRVIISETLKLTKDGKAVNSREGTFTLHEGDGKRVLTFSNPRGSGKFTPMK